jgi:hypothetical protein
MVWRGDSRVRRVRASAAHARACVRRSKPRGAGRRSSSRAPAQRADAGQSAAAPSRGNAAPCFPSAPAPKNLRRGVPRALGSPPLVRRWRRRRRRRRSSPAAPRPPPSPSQPRRHRRRRRRHRRCPRGGASLLRPHRCATSACATTCSASSSFMDERFTTASPMRYRFFSDILAVKSKETTRFNDRRVSLLPLSRRSTTFKSDEASGGQDTDTLQRNIVRQGARGG